MNTSYASGNKLHSTLKYQSIRIVLVLCYYAPMNQW